MSKSIGELHIICFSLIGKILSDSDLTGPIYCGSKDLGFLEFSVIFLFILEKKLWYNHLKEEASPPSLPVITVATSCPTRHTRNL